MNLIEKIFGTHSEREIKMITPIVKKIEDMRDAMMSLSDDELKYCKIQGKNCRRRKFGFHTAGSIRYSKRSCKKSS